MDHCQGNGKAQKLDLLHYAPKDCTSVGDSESVQLGPGARSDSDVLGAKCCKAKSENNIDVSSPFGDARAAIT